MNAELARLAAAVWDYRLEYKLALRVTMGLGADRIPADGYEDVQDEVAAAKALRRELLRLDRARLDAGDQITWDFLDYTLGLGEAAEGLWWSRFSIAPYSGNFFARLLRGIFSPFAFEHDGDVERYRQLMRDYAALANATHDKLKRQVARGWVLPAPALPGALKLLTGVSASIEGVLNPGTERLGALRGANSALKAISETLDTEIRPALTSLIAYVQGDYARQAPNQVGMGQYPGGEEAYHGWMRYNLTEDRDAHELHELGLSEIEALREKMRVLRRQLCGTEDEASFFEHVVATGRMHASSPEAVAERYDSCMARFAPLMSQAFSTLPKAPYASKRIDPALEAGMSYGYYQPPKPGTPGYYMYNGSDLDTRCQLTSAALIYHELAPGHHLHVARQLENDALPEIRRNAFELTVYNEGWAEYASELAGEMGMYDDPYDQYGRLALDSFMAQRLVIDTGMNVFGWPLEKARRYMKANTLESDAQVATETIRYATDWPSQSLTYRYGQLRFQQMRQRAKSALGARFDLPGFHEAVLANGALPMPLLERQVDAYIAAPESAAA